MKKAVDNICPRCTGPVPRAGFEGVYPGALSRTDNLTEICSKCGQDEAMTQTFAHTLVPAVEWPVTKFHFVTESLEAAEAKFREEQ